MDGRVRCDYPWNNCCFVRFKEYLLWRSFFCGKSANDDSGESIGLNDFREAFHFLLSRTTVVRYRYAVGGNAETVRLSGLPVKKVLLWAYACTCVLA